MTAATSPDLLAAISEDMDLRKTRFFPILPAEMKTYPIPYFGNVESATVLTVGVNPAASEFDRSRTWPANLTPTQLHERLLNYFQLPEVPAHRWFETWEKALNILGLSYYDGSAAHIDLSPCATINMGNVPDPELFLEMVESDLSWFFRIVKGATACQLLLLAGSITNRYYVNEFVERHCQQHGFNLSPQFDRTAIRGEGKTMIQMLAGPSQQMPTFFCSTSPSARRSRILIDRIAENQNAIRDLLR